MKSDKQEEWENGVNLGLTELHDDYLQKVFRRAFIMRKFLSNNNNNNSFHFLYTCNVSGPVLHKDFLVWISWQPHGVRIIIPALQVWNWDSEREATCPVLHSSSKGRTRIQTYVFLTPRSFCYIALPPHWRRAVHNFPKLSWQCGNYLFRA